MPIGATYIESMQLLAQTQAAQACDLSFEGVYDVSRQVKAASKGEYSPAPPAGDVNTAMNVRISVYI